MKSFVAVFFILYGVCVGVCSGENLRASNVKQISSSSEIKLKTAVTGAWTADYTIFQPWTSVKSDPSGSNAYAIYNGGMYRSKDFGVIWTRLQTSWDFSAVTTEVTGSVVVGCVRDSGIYVSTNFGQNWQLMLLEPTLSFNDVAMDSVGKYIYAVSSLGIYCSHDFGATWTNVPGSYTSVAVNLEGNFIVAGSQQTGIWYSTDYGVQWTQLVESIAGSAYTDIAMSCDGMYIVGVTASASYVSKNSGLSWSQISTTLSFNSVAMNDKGTLMIATASGKGIYRSTDFGTTWVQDTTAPTANWISVTADATGNNLVATDGEYLYYYITEVPTN